MARLGYRAIGKLVSPCNKLPPVAALQVCAAARELGMAGVCSAAAALYKLAALLQHQAQPAGEPCLVTIHGAAALLYVCLKSGLVNNQGA